MEIGSVSLNQLDSGDMVLNVAGGIAILIKKESITITQPDERGIKISNATDQVYFVRD